MSIEAIHYVMKADIPDGIAKLVAFVIADYAHSETGQAWPKVETLARKCSQSVRTVQRKVRVLEEMGVLRIEPRHTEAGRQRENLFVLYLPGVPRPAANDQDPAPDMGDTRSPIEPRKAVDPVTPEGDRSDTPEGDTAVTPRGIPEKESPKGILPPPPRGGALAPTISNSDGLTPDAAARFERLWRAFPESGRFGAPQASAARSFAELAASEQDLAIRTAAAYAAACEANRSQARRLDRWLRDGLWRNAGAPAAASGAAARPVRIFVREGSAEWEAWARYLRGRGRPMPTPTAIGGVEGWRFDSMMPPAEVA